MRLICPNCGAQYEVPEDVIPDEGRDVQCSNCGDTWFQASPHRAEAAAPVETQRPPAASGPESSDPAKAETPTTPRAAGEDGSARQEDLSVADARSDGPLPDAEPTDAASADLTMSRKLAPEISRVLREEAAREAALRAAQHTTLETQTEFGLTEPEQNTQALQEQRGNEHTARIKGDPEALPQEGADEPHVPPPSRRGLLPDIEEINSTLTKNSQSAADVRTAAAASMQDDRASGHRATTTSGFTSGFVIVVCLAAVAILIYAKAPAISQSLPQLDPLLSAYVDGVDRARIWLDVKAQSWAGE